MTGSRKQALKLAIQQRRCPPFSIKQELKEHRLFKKHCAICPFCHGHDADIPDSEGWAELARCFQSKFSTAVSAKGMAQPKPGNLPVPGQIRILKPLKQPWKENFHFNPPLVFILDSIEYNLSSGIAPGNSCAKDNARLSTVQVAQIFSHAALTGPGDLIIGDFFIETWNIYPVSCESLRDVIDQMEESIVADVKKMHSSPHYLPEWAETPMPLRDGKNRSIDGGVREYFRKMELETALLFQAKSMYSSFGEAMAYEQLPDILPHLLADEMTRIFQGVTWARSPGHIREVLVTPSIPHRYLPRAAASTNGENAPCGKALVYIHEKGRISHLIEITREVTCMEEEGGITCSIFFPDMPLAPEKAWAFTGIDMGENGMLWPETMDVSIKDHSLFARFSIDSCSAVARLKCALFFQYDDDSQEKAQPPI